MSEKPTKHWSRFSLRGLFFVVTLAAIVTALAWQCWPSAVLPLGEFMPEHFAQMHPADCAAICQEVALTFHEPILSFTVEGPRRVSVTTGFLRGPKDGDGHEVVLEKQWWSWKVVQLGVWAA